MKAPRGGHVIRDNHKRIIRTYDATGRLIYAARANSSSEYEADFTAEPLHHWSIDVHGGTTLRPQNAPTRVRPMSPE